MTLAAPAVAFLLIFCPALPATAQASPQAVVQAASDDEARDYSARETANPRSADFEAGDALGGLISLLIIVALVCLIWYILTGGRR